ncbi:DUF1648 domain-containing protein [Cohnella lubricantis]|uniref:DUF1648 domain-containing protein n=1 Tax=Cohnella lubricantis TaxID=2163172 RepID=A0A841TGM4_9BACL|nr:DUF1648 domain-containing protein [Cohnella lubricantis]MBB6677601.1 DUF1648 domain-containing protein [Cohnella lubricantis]MBP2116512.1 putative membrane protein [Cohnella lubricantis]
MTIQDWSWTTLTIFGLTLLLSALVFSLTANYGLRALLFGVYVPEEERQLPSIAALRRRYQLRVWIAAAVIFAAGAAWILAVNDEAALYTPLAALLQIAVCGALFFSSRREALRLKAERGWGVEASGKRVAGLHSRLGNLTVSDKWFAVHGVVVAACVVCAIVFWDRIPDSLATHYGINGEPDRISNKSIGTVFLMNFFQLFLIGLFWFVQYSIRASKLQLDPRQPNRSLEKQRRFRKVNSAFLMGFSLLLILFFGVLQGFMIYEWPQQAMNIVLVAFLIVLIGSILVLVVYLSRKGLDPQPNTPPDERHWRAGGLFYYNPDDAALFVHKQFGVGWTFNMARPMAWVILSGVIAVPLLLVLISVLLT